MLEVTKKDAKKIFAGLGYKTVKKWDSARLERKLKHLSKEGTEEVLESKKLSKILAAIIKAKGKVKLTTDETATKETEKIKVVPRGAPKKRKKSKEEKEMLKMAEDVTDVVMGKKDKKKGKKKDKKKGGLPSGKDLEIDAKENVTKKKKVKKTDKKKESTKPATKTKGDGVVGTIINLLKKKHYTKEQILAQLIKKFPDRGEKMKGTVSTYVPFRLNFDKKLGCKKDAKGKYYIE